MVKALLARVILVPDSADALRARIATFPGSPYLAYLQGRDDGTFARLEDSLAEAQARLTAENQNFSDATLYAVWGAGTRQRLGMVTGLTSQTFQLNMRGTGVLALSAPVTPPAAARGRKARHPAFFPD